MKVNVDTGMAAIALRELLDRVSEGNLSPGIIIAIATETIESNPLLGNSDLVERAIKGDRQLHQLLKAVGIEVLKQIFLLMEIEIAMLEGMAY